MFSTGIFEGCMSKLHAASLLPNNVSPVVLLLLCILVSKKTSLQWYHVPFFCERAVDLNALHVYTMFRCLAKQWVNKLRAEHFVNYVNMWR